MLDILQKIAQWKVQETASRKLQFPLDFLQNQALYHTPCVTLSEKLKNSNTPQIIAEFKRKSPSKGLIREFADPVNITQAYEIAGAAAISVLTDQNFFGAYEDDFSRSRKSLLLPMLRKEFILEKYQIHESKSMGADIILLIASLLSRNEVMEMGSLARELGMDVLLELHEEEELDRICEPVSIIGVNNRNLKTFEVDLQHSIGLSKQLPAEIPTVAESGISHPSDVQELFRCGFKGFLIGETFMKTGDPGQNCREMILAAQNTAI